MKKYRTNEENRYYWGVVIKAYSMYFNEHPNKIHFRVKNEFKIISTSFLSTVDFESLMDKLRVKANLELGVFIPLPNEDAIVELPPQPKKYFCNNFDLKLTHKKPTPQ
jgi:hypothetical protein